MIEFVRWQANRQRGSKSMARRLVIVELEMADRFWFSTASPRPAPIGILHSSMDWRLRTSSFSSITVGLVALPITESDSTSLSSLMMPRM